jgi:hypothetical protein
MNSLMALTLLFYVAGGASAQRLQNVSPRYLFTVKVMLIGSYGNPDGAFYNT